MSKLVIFANFPPAVARVSRVTLISSPSGAALVTGYFILLCLLPFQFVMPTVGGILLGHQTLGYWQPTRQTNEMPPIVGMTKTRTGASLWL